MRFFDSISAKEWPMPHSLRARLHGKDKTWKQSVTGAYFCVASFFHVPKVSSSEVRWNGQIREQRPGSSCRLSGKRKIKCMHIHTYILVSQSGSCSSSPFSWWEWQAKCCRVMPVNRECWHMQKRAGLDILVPVRNGSACRRWVRIPETGEWAFLDLILV